MFEDEAKHSASYADCTKLAGKRLNQKDIDRELELLELQKHIVSNLLKGEQSEIR